MTVGVDGIKRLMRSNKAQYQNYLVETEIAIKQAEENLVYLREYKQKLSFYLDKSTKMLEIVEMAEKQSKPFSELHKRLYETDIYADKSEVVK